MVELRGAKVVIRPMLASDVEALRRLRAEPSVQRWWDVVSPEWPEPPGEREGRWSVLVEDVVAGFMQHEEQSDPDARSVDVDIFLGEAFQGRGLGAEAMTLLVDWLTSERGHHRVTLSADARNSVAIRCYEKVGFRRVGLTEASWRWSDGVWRDEVLMELVRRRR